MEDYFKPTIVGEEIDPREEAVLMGYGSNVARSTPEGWVRPGGEAMSDEDAQALHEETLSRREKEWGEESEKFAGKKKPTDKELTFVEQWKDFEADARKEIETEGKKRADAVVAEMESKFKRDVPDSYWVLHPRELATKNEKLAVAHQHIYDKFVTENMNGVRSAFEKDWQNKEKKAAYEEKLADKREDAEEKKADRAEEQRIRDEGRFDERTKAYLVTLRSEQSDIGKELRGIKAQLTKYGVANPDVIPPTLAKNELIASLASQYQQIRGRDVELEDKIKGIILNKPSEAKALEEQTPTETTGKYTDADVGKTVIKNGKKYIVRKR